MPPFARNARSRSTSASSSSSSSTAPGPSRPVPSPVQSVPPAYPPEVQPPPVYNSRPAANEDTLLAGALPPPDHVYTCRSKQITVALTGQERAFDAGETDNPAHRPSYGKGATIAGVVELNELGGLKLADVLHVSLTVCQTTLHRVPDARLITPTVYRFRASSSSRSPKAAKSPSPFSTTPSSFILLPTSHQPHHQMHRLAHPCFRFHILSP